jgi:hypothetical protein
MICTVSSRLCKSCCIFETKNEQLPTVHTPAGAAAPVAKCNRPPPSRIPGGTANQPLNCPLSLSLPSRTLSLPLSHSAMAATRLSPLLATAPWPRSAPARPRHHISAQEEQGRHREGRSRLGASRRRVARRRARAPSFFRATCRRRSTASTASIRRRRRPLPVLAGFLDLKSEAATPRPRRLPRSEGGALRSEGGPPRSGDPARREAEQRQAGDDDGEDPPFPPAAQTPLPRPGFGDAPFFPRRRRRGRTATRSDGALGAPARGTALLLPGRHILPRLLPVLLSACGQLQQAMREGKHETAAGHACLRDRNVCILGSFADALRDLFRSASVYFSLVTSNVFVTIRSIHSSHQMNVSSC